MNSRKKIKVLETIRQGSIGGGESHVLDLVAGINKDIFEPIVLSFTQGPMVEKLKEQGIKTYVVETEKPFNFTVWPKVKRIMKHEEIDILHAHGTRANSNTFKSAKALNIPVIYTVHGWSFHADQQALIKKLRVASEKFLVHQSDKTICVSDSNFAEGQSYFPMTNALVIKNGINQKKFDPHKQFTDVRRELNIDPSTILVGFIARITAQKDPFTLIKAASKIPDSMNIKFLIVGDGDLKEQTVKMAKELNVSHKILFQNFRQDIPDILNAIDIYCLPSLWEGLSIALLEAMAMKKAIIATAVDGTKEVIRNEYNGLFVEVQQADQLAAAIIRLAQNTAFRKELADNAYNTILQDFNVKKMIDKIEEVYFAIFNKK